MGADCIGYLRNGGFSRVEARAETGESWVMHIRDVAGGPRAPPAAPGISVPTCRASCAPYVGGFPAYVQKCDAVAANGYEGFALT
jgi:cyclohexanone monooxygenase